jgi:hypothetical protein
MIDVVKESKILGGINLLTVPDFNGDGNNHSTFRTRTVIGEADFLAIHDTEEMIVVAVFKDTVDGWTGLKQRLPFLSLQDVNDLSENMATEDKRYIIYPVEELLL